MDSDLCSTCHVPCVDGVLLPCCLRKSCKKHFLAFIVENPICPYCYSQLDQSQLLPFVTYAKQQLFEITASESQINSVQNDIQLKTISNLILAQYIRLEKCIRFLEAESLGVKTFYDNMNTAVSSFVLCEMENMEMQLNRRMNTIDQSVKDLVLMMRQLKNQQKDLISFNNDNDDSLNEVQQSMKKEIITNQARKILQRCDDYITKLNKRVSSVLQQQKEDQSGNITGSLLNSKDSILHSHLQSQTSQQIPIQRQSNLGQDHPAPFQLPFRFQIPIPIQSSNDVVNPLAPYTFPPSYITSTAIESYIVPPYMEYSFVIPQIMTRVFIDQKLCFQSPVYQTQPFPFKWRLHVYPHGIMQAKQQQQFIFDGVQKDKEKDKDIEITDQNQSSSQLQPVRISTVNKITNEIHSGFVNAENFLSVFVELVDGFQPQMISQAIKYFPPAVPASEYIELDQKRIQAGEQQQQKQQQQLNQEKMLNMRQIDNIDQQSANQIQQSQQQQNISMKNWQNPEDDIESELSDFHKRLREEGLSNFSENQHPHFFNYKIQMLCEDPTLTNSRQRTQTFEGNGIFNINNLRGQNNFITHKQMKDDNFLWRGDESAHFVFGVRFPTYKREAEALRLVLMQQGNQVGADDGKQMK